MFKISRQTVHWVAFVAGRHFRTRRREKGHTASILSVSGIAVGVMTLVTVLAVMNGFQLATIQDILEINSYHLRLYNLDARQAERIAGGPAAGGINAVVPFTEVETIARGYFERPRGVLLRALPADVLQRDWGLSGRIEMLQGSFAIDRPGAVVIGSELARAMGVRVGDTVWFVNLGGERLDWRSPQETALSVSGIFRTGTLEFDQSWGFISLEEARESFGVDERPIWGVKLQDRFADRRVAALLRSRLALDERQLESWRSYNRAIFSALRVEKTMLMVLVGLIFLVVGVNIFQSLRRSVIERTEEIATLKALGAPPGSLQAVFVLEGVMIGFIGAAIGTALGLLLSQNINAAFAAAEAVVLTFQELTGAMLRPLGIGVGAEFSLFSPQYFYIDQVPAEVLLPETLGVFAFALVSAAVAALAASRRATRITPAEVLRYE